MEDQVIQQPENVEENESIKTEEQISPEEKEKLNIKFKFDMISNKIPMFVYLKNNKIGIPYCKPSCRFCHGKAYYWSKQNLNEKTSDNIVYNPEDRNEMKQTACHKVKNMRIFDMKDVISALEKESENVDAQVQTF